MNQELPDAQARFRKKAEEPEIKPASLKSLALALPLAPPGKPRHALLLLLLSRLSRVRLCVTPQTAAHQAPPSLGFSRKEH